MMYFFVVQHCNAPTGEYERAADFHSDLEYSVFQAENEKHALEQMYDKDPDVFIIRVFTNDHRVEGDEDMGYIED